MTAVFRYVQLMVLSDRGGEAGVFAPRRGLEAMQSARPGTRW